MHGLVKDLELVSMSFGFSNAKIGALRMMIVFEEARRPWALKLWITGCNLF